jgi:hypothetical protein
VLAAFHPELTDDSRLHAYLMALATTARGVQVDDDLGRGQAAKESFE